MKRFLILVSCAALCACATRPKTYQPPSSSKIIASSQRVSSTVTKAQTTAAKAQKQVKDAKSTAEEVVAVSAIVERQVQDVPNAPPELLNTINRLMVKEGILTSQLFDANQTNDMLFHELGAAQTARIDLQKDQVEYIANAQKLANDATSERDGRIKAEKALSWYRWHSLFLKLVTGLIVLVIIGVLFLWLTGKLAGLAAKLT